MKLFHLHPVCLGLALVFILPLLACAQAKTDMSDRVLAQQPPETLVWQRINDMPVGVFEAALSRQGRLAVVTGGINQVGQASNLVQVLNLDTLKWTTPLVLKEGISYHTQVTLDDGRIFIAGGKTGSLLEKMNRTTHTWLIAADLKTVTAGPDLSGPAHKLTSHLLGDGNVVVIANKLASIYDPKTNKWTRHIALRQKRVEHDSTMLHDGRVLVAGGIGKKTIEVVDLKRGVSVQLASEFDGPRDDLSVVTLPDGRVLLMGGQDSYTGRTIDENLVLDLSDPHQSVMRKITPMGIKNGVSDLSVVTLGKWIFALGGESDLGDHDLELNEARIINGKSLEIWSLPGMIAAHDDAVAVADGRSVFIIGGYSMNEVVIGPLKTRLPTAVLVVERLVLPVEKFE